MPSTATTHLLDQLDALKSRFGAQERRSIERILSRLPRSRFADADALLRYHEILLFLRAYPQSSQTLRLADRELAGFAKRIDQLEETDADLSELQYPEASGVAGVSVTDTFSYYIVRWLATRSAGQVSFDWESFEDEYRLAETWPRFMPLLEEDGFVEANVPYPEWLRAASGGKRRELRWLIEQFEKLDIDEKEKAELYDSQKLYVTWAPSYHESRTGMRLGKAKGAKVYYHREPLMQRRDISLRHELNEPSPPLTKLSAAAGERILDLTRAASTIRYRELWGFTHGDPARVFQASLGRGVEVFIMGVPSAKRLPLRAYHAAMIFKNGVAVGYFEGISLFERMEGGFNLYYTFRDGETAWLYARILSIFRHLLGVTAFAIDPYQIGYENEEGIESGAFWFYRKLGFRPTKPDVLKLVLNEERKIASRKNYRTSATTLRKLAAGPMIFELAPPGNNAAANDWDRFSVRNIGLAVQRRMAAKHGGSAEKFRSAAVEELSRALGKASWRKAELPALNDFAAALSLVPELQGWSDDEKGALARIIKAKATGDESRYLKLMQKHARLRAAIINLGSR